MIDLTEIRLARALGRAIDSCIANGDIISTEILEAYAELHKHWNDQIEREMS